MEAACRARGRFLVRRLSLIKDVGLASVVFNRLTGRGLGVEAVLRVGRRVAMSQMFLLATGQV